MPQFRSLLLAAALVGVPVAVPASPKPCRDANGRVITCPKPARPTPKRCKDAAGRFVKCATPGTHPGEATQT